ncbi:hypothetical protein N7508_002885 [Penicillium antarcticum]|uniref:uncharacterized protein n=1 Tax=Penicillium antarcticum TaxID=416450 RepID=UPI00239773CB|nr:uncharacterized protein N7508_002885 [Penicillium antarcticum]KAJ5312055.1 hypothetical protein N7508_002885 [Penicillium antarcticum]
MGVELDELNQPSMLHRQLHQCLEASSTRHLSNEETSTGNAYGQRPRDLSRINAVILITTLSGITFVGSMSGGLLTVGLPTIAADLDLPDNLLPCLGRPQSTLLQMDVVFYSQAQLWT